MSNIAVEKLASLMGKLNEQGAGNLGTIINRLGQSGMFTFAVRLASMSDAEMDTLAGLLNQASPDSLEPLVAWLGAPAVAGGFNLTSPPSAGTLLDRSVGIRSFFGWLLALVGLSLLLAMVTMYFSSPPKGSTEEQHRSAALVSGGVCGLTPLFIGLLLLWSLDGLRRKRALQTPPESEASLGIRARRIWGWILAVIGGLFLALAIAMHCSPPAQANTAEEQKTAAVACGLMFGASPLAIGMCLLWNARQLRRRLNRQESVYG